MNSVFVRVKSLPTNLSVYEMAVSKPTFVDEVRACLKRKGSSATIGPNYLRAIAEEIGRKYDKSFNPYRHVVPQDFAGRICDTDEKVAETVREMFNARYPQIFDKYLEAILRSRPFNVRIIYLNDDGLNIQVLKKLGIEEISLEEVNNYLGDKAPQQAIHHAKAATPAKPTHATEEKPVKIETHKTEQAKQQNPEPAQLLAEITQDPQTDLKQDELKVEAAKQQVINHNKNKHNNRPKQPNTSKPINSSLKEPNV